MRPPRPRFHRTAEPAAAEPRAAGGSDVELILRDWEDAGGQGSVTDPVQRSWNLPVVLSLAGLVIWSLLAVVSVG